MSGGSSHVRNVEPEPVNDGPWYVRDRGKVTGPHSLDQLAALRRRGQLSRIHEVSRDRQAWVSASNFIDLLEGATGIQPTSLRWYYSAGQSSIGPVSEQELLELMKQGRVHADTKVWRNGLPSWIALRESELHREASPTTTSPSPSPRPGGVRLRLGIASGIVGALVAVSLGLIYVIILNGKGTRKDPDPERVRVQIYLADPNSPAHVESKSEKDDIDHWIDRAKGASEAFKNVVEPFTGRK